MAQASAPAADPTRVAFAPDYWARLERLVARSRAARGRDPGAGRGGGTGGGDEFVGHRPYRTGEELRHLDWALLARSERAFVRVFRREVGERWVFLLDASASMGLGRPGKLQCAAEVVTALAACGAAAGATARLRVSQASAAQGAALAGSAELGGWIALLEGLRAAGSRGLGALCGDAALISASRVFLVGDLLDLEPASVVPLAGRGRRVELVQILAPHELAPSGDPRRAVRWIDPETGAGLDLELEPRLAARYSRVLARRLEGWQRLAQRGRIAHGVWSSAAAFESIVQALERRAP
jgi:uncharacterized protein (DUF58 family)